MNNGADGLPPAAPPRSGAKPPFPSRGPATQTRSPGASGPGNDRGHDLRVISKSREAALRALAVAELIVCDIHARAHQSSHRGTCDEAERLAQEAESLVAHQLPSAPDAALTDIRAVVRRLVRLRSGLRAPRQPASF